MACVLRAQGAGFDVGAFLAQSPFARHAVPTPKASTPGEDTRAGFNLTVSTAGFDDLTGQVDDAIGFLDEFEDELRRLGRCDGVSAVSLDFGIRRREVPIQTDAFPPDLLWRAGALDIALEVTHYALTD